jgi:hypothetical protein
MRGGVLAALTAAQRMHAMLGHDRHYGRHVGHLMARRRWIITDEQAAAMRARGRAVVDDLVRREQLASMPSMAGLPAAFAALLSLAGRLPRRIARRRLRGVARVPSQPRFELRDAGFQLLDAFLLASNDRLLRFDDRKRLGQPLL